MLVKPAMLAINLLFVTTTSNSLHIYIYIYIYIWLSLILNIRETEINILKFNLSIYLKMYFHQIYNKTTHLTTNFNKNNLHMVVLKTKQRLKLLFFFFL